MDQNKITLKIMTSKRLSFLLTLLGKPRLGMENLSKEDMVFWLFKTPEEEAHQNCTDFPSMEIALIK